MQVEQSLWLEDTGWETVPALSGADLVLYFGGKNVPFAEHYERLKSAYPKAHLLGCSTGGEINGPDVLDGSLVAAALQFKHTKISATKTTIDGPDDSYKAGEILARALNAPDLSYILLLSDGMHVNGSALVEGIYNVVPDDVIVTGGLAGDGADFKSTLVGLDSVPAENVIAAVGFYGDALKVGFGSVGGWKAFGPQRQITKSKGNVLYELDGSPALDLYKLYLGEAASRLPSSALLFPLSIKPDGNSEHEVVRTCAAIDEDAKSMTFVADIPEGYVAQLMRGDFNNLVDGAIKAASLAQKGLVPSQSLAILVSCIGRKLLLGQQISDEAEAVADVLGNNVPMIGFYSYGEICHQQFTGKCSLHNQTMTVTVLQEDE